MSGSAPASGEVTAAADEGAQPRAGGAAMPMVVLGGLVVCLVAATLLVVGEAPLALLPLALAAVFGVVLARRVDTPAPNPIVQRTVVAQPTEDPLAHFVATAEQVFAVGEGNPSVVIVELEGFRDVRTVMGEERAAEVLAAVAGRIDQTADGRQVRPLDEERWAMAMLSRPFLPAHHLARRIQEAVAQPLLIDGVNLRLRTRAGVALGEGGATSLVRQAKAALAEARTTNESLVVHTPEPASLARRRLEIVTGLTNAMESDDPATFAPLYQPIVDTRGALVSAEALARWNDPTMGAISPEVFIPLAEQTGLIAPLFSRVLRHSLQACRRWKDAGVDASLSINVSAKNFHDPLMTSELTACVEEAGLSPEEVTLEITESMILEDYTGAVRRVKQLRTLGFPVALDDFGVGQSSLARLRELPVSVVKLDKLFIAGLPHDEKARGIVRATVEVCHLLGLQVVAEGVERDEQADLLIDMGVIRLQGFLFSPAISVEDIVSGPLVAEVEEGRGA